MDGNFIIPNGLNFSLENCRNPKACPAIPEPPAENNLKAEPEDITITDGVPQDTLEHTIFEFSCNEEFTLAGVIHDTYHLEREKEIQRESKNCKTTEFV